MIFGPKRTTLLKRSRRMSSTQQDQGELDHVHLTQERRKSWNVETSVYPAEHEHAPPLIPLRSPARVRPQSCYSAISMSTEDSVSPAATRRVPGLRRKHAPTQGTLREIRNKQSEAALRSAYETQTLAYLSDSITSHSSPTATQRFRWSTSDGSNAEDIPEEDEDDNCPSPNTNRNWWTLSTTEPRF